MERGGRARRGAPHGPGPLRAGRSCLLLLLASCAADRGASARDGNVPLARVEAGWARIERYIPLERRGPRAPCRIRCRMVAEPVFFEPAHWIAQPRDWPPHTVQGKRHDLARGEGARIWDERLGRAAARRPEFVSEGGAPRFGEGRLVRPRLGEGTFRLSVAQACHHACAVTTGHSLPVLEAARIRRYADGGAHEVRSGILLRSDVHRLFDAGPVTVTSNYNFEVSRELREERNNGRTYYRLHGRRIDLPESAGEYPGPALLAWHSEHEFRG